MTYGDSIWNFEVSNHRVGVGFDIVGSPDTAAGPNWRYDPVLKVNDPTACHPPRIA